MIFKLAQTEAAAEHSSGGIGAIFTALGLNVPSLVLNALAFLVVAWILGKFVYPHLMGALDAKQGELEGAARFEKQAQGSLEKAEAKAAEVIAAARTSADEIISAAQADAKGRIEDATQKATAQAERIVAEAREQLDRDIEAARKTLRADTAKLVAEATETVLDEKLDGSRDTGLINRALEGHR